MACDLLLKGATVVDPSQNMHGMFDVAITDRKIDRIESDIQDEAQQIIDVVGKYLTPGWIDLHAHVYAGATTFGIKADALCLATGVTTIVDAGSPGWTNLRGFLE